MYFNIFTIISLTYSTSVLFAAEFIEFIDDNKLVDCDDDKDCASWEICRNYQCFDGCIDGRCGYNARCVPKNHTYTCECLDDLVGDPYVKCIRSCFDDSNCNDHQLCKDNVCVYACDNVTCARNALCTANNHVATCECKFCTEGDATIECIKKKTPYCQGYYYP